MNLGLWSQGKDMICICLPTPCPQPEWMDAYDWGLCGLGLVLQSRCTRIHQGLAAELTVGIVLVATYWVFLEAETRWRYYKPIWGVGVGAS